MNLQQLRADIDKIHTETMRIHERNRHPWGLMRDLGAFFAGAATFAGAIAALYALYGHFRPH